MNIPDELKAKHPRDQLVLRQGPDQRRYRGVVRAEARDEAAAQDLRQVIQGFVALGRMQVGPEHPEISDFIASLQLTGQGKTVSLGFAVPSEMIDVLGAVARGTGPAEGRRPRRCLNSRNRLNCR